MRGEPINGGQRHADVKQSPVGIKVAIQTCPLRGPLRLALVII
jgi:hypothetical protein